tara:strand:+ start:68501 stop:69481 length:981 start_codon:yes stop_codon:yes gene_type:complete
MPNVDGGHYFLTVLVPLKNETFIDRDGAKRSASEVMRRALACLPTAQHSAAAKASGFNSPFARNKRTHFTRFVVINDVGYEGRPHEWALTREASGGNPLIPQKVDHLKSSYLLWTVDFDKAVDGKDDLDSYLKELWSEMEPELKVIFETCYGFHKVTDANLFSEYIISCQLETTMSFNDYWKGPPPLAPQNKKNWIMLIVGALAVIMGITGLLHEAFEVSWLNSGLFGIVFALIFAYLFVMIKGGKAFPAAPNSDLKTVLKSLYLQQKLVNFAIKNQAVTDQQIFDNFGQFIVDHEPDNMDKPTQGAGLIASSQIASFSAKENYHD